VSRDSIISLGLLAWFTLLAVAEVITAQPGRKQSGGGDARLVTNFGLTAVNLILSGLVPLASVTAASVSQQLGIGLAHQVPLPWLTTFALTLGTQSFATYWLHRLMHKEMLLWRVHRVHHADSEVDVSTSLRNHPLELLLTLPISALVIMAIGSPISAVVVCQAFLLAATIWQHADIALPRRIDTLLALFFVTPKLHRLHHSPVRLVHDSNFGELFTVWDRLFGTFKDIEGRSCVGLVDQLARPDHFLEQLWSPVQPTAVEQKGA
jgi:sterol desaturase/sphingolipid hydroxylase (fatty acid hydroxylase superfamily)